VRVGWTLLSLCNTHGHSDSLLKANLAAYTTGGFRWGDCATFATAKYGRAASRLCYQRVALRRLWQSRKAGSDRVPAPMKTNKLKTVGST